MTHLTDTFGALLLHVHTVTAPQRRVNASARLHISTSYSVHGWSQALTADCASHAVET